MASEGLGEMTPEAKAREITKCVETVAAGDFECFRHELEGAIAHCLQAERDKVDVLKAALEPLARITLSRTQERHAPEVILWASDSTAITIGDVKRARAALKLEGK